MKITDKQLLCRIKQRCEEDFEFFVRYFFSLQHGAKFRFSWHHHEITKALMRVFNGETTHLIINMPPRYSKTELVVKMFTAWCFMKNPSCEFIHLSYSEALALDNSNAIRDLIKSQEFQQLWPIGLCKDAANAWKTTESGVFLARAAGGQVTGYGAGKVDDFEDGRGFCGCILIDDPLKPTDAHSETLRENINRRWDAVIKSRFNSPRTPCRECLDFCVQGGFQGGSQSRLPFVYRGLKINDQRLMALSRRHKCAKHGECGAPSDTRRIPSYLASFHRVGKALTEQ